MIIIKCTRRPNDFKVNRVGEIMIDGDIYKYRKPNVN